MFLAPNGDQEAIKRGRTMLPGLLANLENGLQHSEYLAAWPRSRDSFW